jgi:hypothetical protein
VPEVRSTRSGTVDLTGESLEYFAESLAGSKRKLGSALIGCYRPNWVFGAWRQPVRAEFAGRRRRILPLRHTETTALHAVMFQ